MRLLSRNADALFWLARYLERASSLARVIEMQSSYGGQTGNAQWAWLIALHNDEKLRERFEDPSQSVIAYYLTDMSNPGSVRAAIHYARENARALRPFIPLEMWSQLNAFHTKIEAISKYDIEAAQLPRTCAEIRGGCLSQIGVADGTLFRDEGYLFFKIGLMVERADQTSRLLDVKFAQSATSARTDDSDDFVFWSTILRTAAAFQVFRRLEPTSTAPERVVRFLTQSPSHPRSIGFCVREINEALMSLHSGFKLHKTAKSLEACEVLGDGLQAAAKDAQLLSRLHDFNDWVQRALIALTAEISAAFFVPEQLPAPPAQSQSQTQGAARGAVQEQKQS